MLVSAFWGLGEMQPCNSNFWICPYWVLVYSGRLILMNSVRNQWHSVVVCGPDESAVCLLHYLGHNSLWLQLNHLHSKVIPDRSVSDGWCWGPVAHAHNVVTNKGNPSSQGTFSIWSVLLLWLALPVCGWPFKEKQEPKIGQRTNHFHALPEPGL